MDEIAGALEHASRARAAICGITACDVACRGVKGASRVCADVYLSGLVLLFDLGIADRQADENP